MRYILNSAVITSEGLYRYRLLSRPQAVEWLASGRPVRSTIRYQETCDAFALMFGVEVEPNAENVTMQEGDEALVFRLTRRVTEGMKGRLGVAQVLQEGNYEIGLLVREE